MTHGKSPVLLECAIQDRCPCFAAELRILIVARCPLRMRDLNRQVKQVALESTGISWRPIFNLLEGRYEIVLVNAQHMHAIPGHKTDIKDSEWIADLLRHGLLKASFIPAFAHSGAA